MVTRSGATLTRADLQEWAADKMPPYQVPRVVKYVAEMPRNAMGKVNKKQLAEDMFPERFAKWFRSVCLLRLQTYLNMSD